MSAYSLQDFKERVSTVVQTKGTYLSKLAQQTDTQFIIDAISQANDEELNAQKNIDYKDPKTEIIAQWINTIATKKETASEYSGHYSKADAKSLSTYFEEHCPHPSALRKESENILNNFLAICKKSIFSGLEKNINTDRFIHELQENRIFFKENTPDGLFDCNIMLRREKESAFDYQAICTFFRMSLQENEHAENWSPEEIEDALKNNSLVWLIYQQGYTVEDYISGKESDFLNSVRASLQNIFRFYPEDTGKRALQLLLAVTFCVRMDTETIERVLMGQEQTLYIPKEAFCGIVTPWEEKYDLGFILEKDVLIPCADDKWNMIENIQIERAMNEGFFTMCQRHQDELPLWIVDAKTSTEKPMCTLPDVKLTIASAPASLIKIQGPRL